jgi:RNA polymerase sigma factor (sigma-70 family)
MSEPRDDLDRIVRSAAAGDPVAWSRLVARFRARVLGAARTAGLTHHEAEDAAQATWARLVGAIGRIQDPNAIGAWLHTTARREGLRIRTGQRAVEPLDDELAITHAPDLDRELIAAEERAALRSAVGRLPGRHARLMRAFLADPEPSYAQVSAELGIPLGSIGPIRGRCMARLRRDPALSTLLELT